MGRFLINGQTAATIDIGNRGLAYGDGLFETIRVIDCRPVWLDLHLARLRRGSTRLKLNLDEPLVRAEIIALCEAGDAADQILKVMITRGNAGRGYRPDSTQGVDRILQINPYIATTDSALQGITLFACHTQLARQPLLAGLKHLNRLEQVLAAAELPVDCLEGLMQDTAGQVIEGTRSNIFVVIGGQLCTPALTLAGIDGVLREWLCQTMSVEIRDIRLADVLAAQEVFVGNSVFGIYPVTGIRGADVVDRPFKIGDLTRACQAQLQRATGIIG